MLRLVKLFASLPTADAQKALTRYFALLHYAKLDHATLAGLIPPPPALREQHLAPLALASSVSHLIVNAVTVCAYVPLWLLHIPGYISGYLAGRAFAVKGEEESQAQFKAVGGGLGIGVGIAFAVWILWQRIMLIIGEVTFPPRFLGGDNTTLKFAWLLYLVVALHVLWHNELFDGVCASLRSFVFVSIVSKPVRTVSTVSRFLLVSLFVPYATQLQRIVSHVYPLDKQALHR